MIHLWNIRIRRIRSVINVIIDDIHDCRTGGLTGKGSHRVRESDSQSESQRVRESESEHAHNVTERYTGRVLGVVQTEERDCKYILQEHTSPRVGEEKNIEVACMSMLIILASSTTRTQIDRQTDNNNNNSTTCSFSRTSRTTYIHPPTPHRDTLIQRFICFRFS